VQSFGWIDSEGRLHGSTQFTSDARVRGVRVQSYVEDPAAARVKVDLDVLPTGLVRQAEADPQRCLDSQRRWRQALHVEVSTASDLPLGTVGLMLPVAASTRQAFLEAARDSRRWIAQARPAQPASAYEKALFWRDADRTEWLARIEIGGRVTAPVARIELGPLNQPGPGRRLQMPLPGPGSHPQALALAMADAVADLERQMACEPVWYTVAGSREQLRRTHHESGRALSAAALSSLCHLPAMRPTHRPRILPAPDCRRRSTVSPPASRRPRPHRE